MKDLNAILEKYREDSSSERDKGTLFEVLMKNFLLTYAPYRGRFSNVWLWKDFPFRAEFGGKDLGIDLVAQTVDGEFWAVQCKFYAETSTIDKPAVDSFLATSSKTFQGDKRFSARIWISTTNNFTDNAEKTLQNQSPPVTRIGIEDLRNAAVDWEKLDAGIFGKDSILPRELRDYQIDAINAATEHFQNNSRGQLIMACGTGKTFTALKITEKISSRGKILFLVPSISLLSQTLLEWATYSEKPFNYICVCSDDTVSKSADEFLGVNLPTTPTTDPAKISRRIKNFSADEMSVVFSTYQSLDKVIDAKIDFNLIICDEAHRTAGYSPENEKFFTLVHDDKNIKADKRLYMTATPRMFSSSAQERKNLSTVTLWSMDDEKIFGKEFYSISFKDAIQKGCLTDYKVLVLTIPERSLKKSLLDAINDKNTSIKLDDALKLVGCINALSKKCDEYSKKLLADDLSLMHTAVAFCSKVDNSKHYKEIFKDVQDNYIADLSDDEKENLVNVTWDHVDGKMSSAQREPIISSLKNTTREGSLCRVVSNVRCLSEGVDVPALDAVIFLAPKKSQVEIVQAVGRAMRIANDKKFGYIIIPVIIPISQDPDQVLSKSAFKEVWRIVNSLRAHDIRIDTWVEQIRLSRKNPNKNKPTDGEEHLVVATIDTEEVDLGEILLFDELRDKIYARMVDFVGDPRYWTEWAVRIKNIVERHTQRIKEIISVNGPASTAFYEFHNGLAKNLNPSVTTNDAVDMLAQHLVTRPVFEALFDNNSFAKNNPVSIAMQKILAELDKDGLNKDHEVFDKLYSQVRDQCSGMGDAKTRQEIIIRLYDSFFRLALPITAQKLGIVYTPVEVVDFILNSVNDVLQKNFNRTLSDKNIHVLDPFTGTGTFITRLLQSGLIRKKDLLRKYRTEIHANEMVLLAYYIAAVNIENVFNVEGSPYEPFKGICFTDTFQTYENDDKNESQMSFAEFKNPLKKNSERIKQQLDKTITVIIGNPPYSVGQKSANDNAQNTSYDKLEQRISDTYAAGTNATNKNSLYDSYIKAFRWASDRIGESGVIGFVTNAGWLDGAAMDGLRNCFVKEFSEVYVFNLRGNKRTMGELQRKERQNIFGQGTRSPVAITILVKNPNHVGNTKIFYAQVGDYLTKEDKLDAVKKMRTVLSDEFQIITPNSKGDWINQRGNDFETYLPLAPDKKFNAAAQSFFVANSRGIATARDAWAYNFSRAELEKNIQTTIDYYNTHTPLEVDATKITWTDLTITSKNRKLKYKFDAAQILESFYRPFCKQNFYYDKYLNERVYQMTKIFPTGDEENFLICVPGIGDTKNFSAFIVNKICDLGIEGASQCFPLYWYELPKEMNLFGSDEYERRDGVTDFIWRQARQMYGIAVTKEDIFYYVYGFLHLSSYREKFSAELKKSLPRIFLVDDAKTFWQLVKAGRDLADIHLHYEKFDAPPEVEVIGEESGDYRVKKIRFAKDDKTTLIYNEYITIKNIPPRSFDYVVNGRSPLEWIIDRYQVKVDSASGIENNPNDWCDEHKNPRYILDLILSCITVSLKTLDIVDSLPTVEF